jgi:hypothetical protein
MSAQKSEAPARSNTAMTRSSVATGGSEEDAIPDEDTSEVFSLRTSFCSASYDFLNDEVLYPNYIQVTRLFAERLQAWKHACGYLEDYIKATEKLQHSHGKEYERVLKTVEKPLKEGHHFDQSLGGVAGLFDNVRTNTQVATRFSAGVVPIELTVCIRLFRIHIWRLQKP